MKVPKNDIVCLDLFNSISLAVKLFMLNTHITSDRSREY
ncbi:MAG: hypothetical protein EZS26_001171 [Candidatus Ordinivivax streblomastigis]|uniref:Uncharacterized protein n=1 Tax=Candidatus Ordinivivax streblomastigis TaxID=2540710 RepID=A0A5M8P2P1_9BACT|nr:MAG: hypothetical protein EZS26_001171 [Candidatus Ordinivivax streblomastigis]